MTLLNKSQILSASDRKTEDLEVKEWGGTVRISTMSASDRDKWEQDTYGGEKTKTEDFRARFVALCLVDEKGDRLFTDKDVAQLGAKSAAALDRVFRAAQKLNALGDTAIEGAEKKLTSRPERRLQFRIAWRLGYAHPDQMLAGLDSRQLTEMYAFARMEPLDQHLQEMLAQLTDVLARVHGNETTAKDFLLVKPKAPEANETKVRSQQIMELFQAVAAKNTVK